MLVNLDDTRIFTNVASLTLKLAMHHIEEGRRTPMDLPDFQIAIMDRIRDEYHPEIPVLIRTRHIRHMRTAYLLVYTNYQHSRDKQPTP